MFKGIPLRMYSMVMVCLEKEERGKRSDVSAPYVNTLAIQRQGIRDNGIALGTPFEDLSEYRVCMPCGVPGSESVKEGNT